MILEIVVVAAVAAAAALYVKHRGVAASVAAVKAEVAKIENEVSVEEPVVKAKVLAVVDRIKAAL